MEAVAVQQVLATIRAALSVVGSEREPAEALLRSWEADAQPGFLLSLLRIAEETTGVEEVSLVARLRLGARADIPAIAIWHTSSFVSWYPLQRSPTGHQEPIPIGLWLACKATLLTTGRAALQATRLLAAVIAKNAVGSSWRKTLGTREWSRVPVEEKAAVRESAMRLLLGDPSERCALAARRVVDGVRSAARPARVSWARMRMASLPLRDQ